MERNQSTHSQCPSDNGIQIELTGDNMIMETSRSLALPFGRCSRTVVRRHQFSSSSNLIEPLSAAFMHNDARFVHMDENLCRQPFENTTNTRQLLSQACNRDNNLSSEMAMNSKDENLQLLLNYSNLETIPHPSKLFRKHKKKSSKKQFGFAFYNHLAQLKKKQSEFQWLSSVPKPNVTNICARAVRQHANTINSYSSEDNFTVDTYSANSDAWLNSRDDQESVQYEEPYAAHVKFTMMPLSCQKTSRYRNKSPDNFDKVSFWMNSKNDPSAVSQGKEESDLLEEQSLEQFDFHNFLMRKPTNYINLYNEE